jgi:hypothetical protein
VLFLHAHQETSAVSIKHLHQGELRVFSCRTNELSEESDQFRFLRSVCLNNMKGSVGLILEKASVIWISIPLDFSSRPFIPLLRFIRSRHPTPLHVPSLVPLPPSSD